MILSRPEDEARFAAERAKMVDRQIVDRGVTDARVLSAMRSIPRHLFLPERYRHEAYADSPVLIGHQQTISQPFIVASMTEHLCLDQSDRVLEIGTGCGYQTAVLAELARFVFSIERIEDFVQPAIAMLADLGYHNVRIKGGDGSRGWPEEAPFDAIIVTAAANRLPQNLLRQLRIGGRMVTPLATTYGQQLVKLTKTEHGVEEQYLYAVRFVPLIEDGPDSC